MDSSDGIGRTGILVNSAFSIWSSVAIVIYTITRCHNVWILYNRSSEVIKCIYSTQKMLSATHIKIKSIL